MRPIALLRHSGVNLRGPFGLGQGVSSYSGLASELIAGGAGAGDNNPSDQPARRRLAVHEGSSR